MKATTLTGGKNMTMTPDEVAECSQIIEDIRRIRDGHPPKSNVNPVYHALSLAISGLNRAISASGEEILQRRDTRVSQLGVADWDAWLRERFEALLTERLTFPASVKLALDAFDTAVAQGHSGS